MTDLSYGYDALGNVNATDDALDEVSRTLGYDKLNRYTDETIHNQNAPNGLHRGTGYSAGGNINNRTLVGSYDYGENGAGPHAVTTITHQGDISHYDYDGDGRMTSGGALSAIDWNWSGQVRQLEGTPNVYLNYTPDGDLLTKGVDGEGTARYFGKLFVQLGNDGGWRERIVANGEVVALVNVSSAGYPSVDYMVHDNLGSPAAIVNASGVLEGRYAWNMWGELVNPATYNGSDPNEDTDEALTTLGYTGHEMFWKAGLVHTQMRLYMPGTGRWLSPDPTVPNPYDGQSLNRYSYVLNNPLTFTDPLGLTMLHPIKVIGHCDESCVAARLAGQSLASSVTSGYTGGASGSNGVGVGNPGAQKSSTNKNPHNHCTGGHSEGGLRGFVAVGAKVAAGAGVSASGNVSANVSGNFSASGELAGGAGAGATVYAVAGIQYGSPSPESVSVTGIFSAIAAPFGVYFNFGFGQNGLFMQVGGGAAEGEYYAENAISAKRSIGSSGGCGS